MSTDDAASAVQERRSLKQRRPTAVGVQDTLGVGINAGLCNQKQAFVALVDKAMSWGAAIQLSSLRWRADWKNQDLVPHELIWDVDYWNQDDRLPKLLNDTQIAAMDARTQLWSGKLLWRFYDKYVGKLRGDLGKRAMQLPMLGRSEAERYTMLRLRPTQDIEELAQKLSTGPAYGALHARVERDLLKVHAMDSHTTSLSQIYKHMQKSKALKKLAFSAGPAPRIFLAVSDDVDTATAKLVQSRSAPWPEATVFRGSLEAVQQMEKYKSCQYIVASVVDYELCRRADWFVGVGMSTFSNTIVVDRVMRNLTENFYYNRDVLAPRCDDGRLAWELMNGSFPFSGFALKGSGSRCTA